MPGTATIGWIKQSAGGGGGTTYTTDGSQSDVQAKIDGASAGDTVEIPSGSFTWTAGITCNKAIILKGAGGGRVEGSSTTSLSITNSASRTFTLGANTWKNDFTVGETVRARVKYNSGNWMQGTVDSWNSGTGALQITMSSSSGSGTFACWVFEMPATTTITCNAGSSSLMTLTNPSSGVMHVQAMRISQGTGTADVITINDNSSSGVVLIHDNRFTGGSVRLIGVKTNQGVVYKNYFDAGFDWDNAPNNLVSGSGIANKHAITSSWTTADTMGDRDTTGKSNFYVEDNFFTGFTTECSDFDDNSRTVWRYNIMDNSGLTSHGQDTSSYGARHFEVYNNKFIFDDVGTATANMNYLQYWRGGSGIWTDNTVLDITSSEWGDKGEVTLTVQQLRRNAGPNACWNSGWPSPRQPGQGHDGSTTITEGVYVWGNTGTFSLGLEDYSPDECSGGPAVSTYLQSGRDYFTSAKSGYAKYTYPHPLRA